VDVGVETERPRVRKHEGDKDFDQSGWVLSLKMPSVHALDE
jgi:hypothetical protein